MWLRWAHGPTRGSGSGASNDTWLCLGSGCYSRMQAGWLKLGVSNPGHGLIPVCGMLGHWAAQQEGSGYLPRNQSLVPKRLVTAALNNKCLSHSQEAGSLGSGCQYGWALSADLLPGLQTSVFFLCPHVAERERDLTCLLVRGLISSQWLHLHPNSLPKAPSPKCITFQFRVSTYKFWEVTDFQPIAGH